MIRAMIVLLMLTSCAFGQVQIKDLTAASASQLSDTQTLFGVDMTNIPATRALSLAELKKTGLEVVNVRQYGATGDGVTDDTAAIAAAAAAAATSGSPLYFPAGSYSLATWTGYTTTADLIVTGDGHQSVTITGPGTAQKFINCTAGHSVEVSGLTITAFDSVVNLLANGGTDHESIHLHDLSVSGMVAAVNDTGEANTTVVNSLVVEDCTIRSMTVAGVRCRSQVFGRCIARNLDIETVASSTSSTYGVHFGANAQYASESVVVEHCRIKGITSTFAGGNAFGILVYGIQCRIVGNYVQNVLNDDGFDCYGIYTKVRGGVIANNSLSDAGRLDGMLRVKGLDSEEAGPEPFGFGANVTSNSVYGSASDYYLVGINISASHSKVVGNFVHGGAGATWQKGIAVDVAHCVISDNVLMRLESDNTIVGIGIYSVSDALIANNKLTDFSVSVGSVYGIYLRGATGGPHDNFVVTGNTVDAFASVSTDGGVVIDTNADIEMANIVVSGNLFTSLSRGIYTRGSASTSGNSVSNMDITGNQYVSVTTPISLANNDETGVYVNERGAGSPESVIEASIGSQWRRTDGSTSTTLYVKESGDATNTGWIAK